MTSLRRAATGVADLETYLRVERFDYSRVGERWAVLRLLAALGADLGVPAKTMLLVQRGQETTSYPARACILERRLVARQSGGAGSELLWRATFAVPLEVVEYRNALFELADDGGLALALAEPDRRLLRPQGLILRPACAENERNRRIPGAHVRHRLAALATAVAVTTTSSPAIGLGATGGSQGPVTGGPTRSAVAHASTVALPAPVAAVTPPVCVPTLTTASKTTPSVLPRGQPAVTVCPAPAARHSGHPHKRTHPANKHRHGKAAPSAGRSGRPGPTTTATMPRQPALAGTGALPRQPVPTGGAEAARMRVTRATGPGATRRHAPGRAARPTSPDGGAPIGRLGGLTARPPVKLPSPPTHRTPVARGPGSVPTLSATPTSSIPPAWTGSSGTNPVTGETLTELSGLLADGNRPPAFLIPTYMEAGRRYHVPWAVLAAVNAIETDYGRDLSTSSAGAIGWMQFEPATWRAYGVRADGHSVANPFDPRDAIFSAARYLAANGAAQDLPRAILAYNHAGWYVTDVLARAQAIAEGTPIASTSVKRGVLSVELVDKKVKGGLRTVKGGLLTHYTRLIAAANMVSAAQFPYLYGGGHEQPAIFGPFDCSGAVSYVMQQAGYKVPTTVSGDIASWGFAAGPGRVTIFFNPVHTYMRIGNRFFGTSGFARPGGGAGWFQTNVLPASYLAQFREVHVSRLGTNSFKRLAPASRTHKTKHSWTPAKRAAPMEPVRWR